MFSDLRSFDRKRLYIKNEKKKDPIPSDFQRLPISLSVRAHDFYSFLSLLFLFLGTLCPGTEGDLLPEARGGEYGSGNGENS